MNFGLKYCLSEDNSLDENIFYMSTYLSVVSTLIFSAMGVLLRLKAVFILLSLFLFGASILLFILERKYHKTKLFTYALLTLLNFIVFPTIMVVASFNVVEIPLYYLVGIIFLLFF